MKLDPVLLEILVCPDCKGTLTVDEAAEELVCNDCGLAYPVRDDIPVMLVDEARRPVEASDDTDDDADDDADDDEAAAGEPTG